MAFQQIIAGKVKLNGIGGIRRHLQERERVKTNPDIDLTRSHLNFCIDDLTPDHLVSRVNSRIKQLNLKKHPRSDAVGLEDIIVGASSDFMLQIGSDKQKQYFSERYTFSNIATAKKMLCTVNVILMNPILISTLALSLLLLTVAFPPNLFSLQKLWNNYKRIFITLFLLAMGLSAANIILKSICLSLNLKLLKLKEKLPFSLMI